MIFAQTGGPGVPQFSQERITVKASADIPPNTLVTLAFHFDSRGNLDRLPSATVVNNAAFGMAPTWVGVVEDGIQAGERGECIVSGKAICRYTGSPSVAQPLHVGDTNGTVETGEGGHATFGQFLGVVDSDNDLGAVFITQLNGST